jgi:hypothetical protein
MPFSRRALIVSAVTTVVAAGCLVACGSPETQAVVTSPTPDSTTRNYVALVHNYWIAYKTAEGDLDHISGTSNVPFGPQDAARACAGLPSPTMSGDLDLVDAPTCGKLAEAMVAVHEKFLSDLNMTPPPPKFASDDQALRSQLPKAIADMKAMISATATGNKNAIVDATWSYVRDMQPTVTSALNHVDPSFIHT